MTRPLYFLIAIASILATSSRHISSSPARRQPFHQHAHLRHVHRFPPDANRKILRRENTNAIADDAGEIAAVVANDDTAMGNTTDPPICGQYGFRCIDDQSFQICELTDIDGEREDANVPHECPDDLVCNEDNNAFCSPRFKIENMEPPSTGRRCESEKFKRDVAVAAKPFECQAYGMFPDANNSSMFWFCDRGCHEHQFETKHMMCGQQRHFDADRNECIAPETTQPEPSAAKERRTADVAPFSCNGRKLGKYANAGNCRKYHLCLPAKRDAQTFDEVIFMCPEGMAYDPQREQCDRAAVDQRCLSTNATTAEGNEQMDDGNLDGDVDGDGNSDEGDGDNRCHCATGTRSHDADSKQCDGYLLCVERVELKLQCPHGERFNATLLLCQPKNMVECSAGN